MASSLAYGSMAVLSKLAYADGVSPGNLLAWRFLCAAALLRILPRPPGPALASGRRLSLLVLGAVFVANATCYFSALRHAPASVVAVLVFTYPVIVTLLAGLLGFEPLTLRGLLAALLAVVGAALTASGSGAAALGPGGWLALGAAALYATYVVGGSRLASTLPAESLARAVIDVSALAFGGAALLTGTLAFPPTARSGLALLLAGTACTVVAMRAFLAGVERIGAGRAAVLSAVEVVITLGLAGVALGERPRPPQLLGGALVLGGVLVGNAGVLRRLRGRRLRARRAST
jgi:drug/metabolite transporter (DMT)-like permease